MECESVQWTASDVLCQAQKTMSNMTCHQVASNRSTSQSNKEGWDIPSSCILHKFEEQN